MSKDREENVVSNWWLFKILAEFWGSGDIDSMWEDYRDVDINDEISVKERVIQPVMLPYFERWNEEARVEAKRTLQYFLTADDNRTEKLERVDFGEVLDRALFMFEPREPRKVYEWIWEVFFPGEDYRLEHPEKCIVDRRIEVLQKLHVS